MTIAVAVLSVLLLSVVVVLMLFLPPCAGMTDRNSAFDDSEAGTKR